MKDMVKDTFNKSMERYLESRLVYEKRKPMAPVSKKSGVQIVSSVKDEHPDLNDDVRVHILNKPDNIFIRTWQSVVCKFSKSKEICEDVPKEESLTQDIDEVKEELDSLKEEERIESIKQRSILSRLLKKLNLIERKVDDHDDLADEDFETDVYSESDDANENKKKVLIYKAKLNDEIKTVFLMVNAFIEGLPDKQREEFKHNPDYSKYRKVLAIARKRG